MRTAKNLLWLVIGLADAAVGYFVLWQYVGEQTGAVVLMAIGGALAANALYELRQPKRVVKFNIYKGVVHG